MTTRRPPVLSSGTSRPASPSGVSAHCSLPEHRDGAFTPACDHPGLAFFSCQSDMKTFMDRAGRRIDYRLRQRMAPSMARILEYMEANPGRHADTDLAAACHCDRGVAKDVLNKLHATGILRIAAYRRTGSTPQALYGWACEGEVDATPPPPLTNAEKQKSRRTRLKAMYGEYAWRVHTSRNNGGAETLVIDGRVVYRRKC